MRRESLSPPDIVEAVAGHFRIDLDDMRGRSRSQKIVVPRQVAMYLIRELTKASLVDIGEVLGGRDHTTIMHGIDKINRAVENDASLRSHINQIRETLLTA